MHFKMYAAAVYTNQLMPGQTGYQRRLTDVERVVVARTPHILESYHYVGKQRFVDEMRACGAKVFLDSGAFSAKTLGINISVEEYCGYIQRNIDIVRVENGVLMASVLDDIGDAQITYQNQLAMEALGVRPIPSFHAGEDTRYLDWYIDNYEYISLGGLVGASPKQLQIWLDRVWNNHLLDGAGNPKIMVHGFAVTSVPLMKRYPWHCMTEEDHQVLSRSGWKSYRELIIGEEILCYDKGRSYWSSIRDIPSYAVSNIPVLSLENRNLSARVTENHRWNLYNKARKDWEFRIHSDFAQHTLIPRIGEYTESSEFYTDAEVELFAWYWTEGTINHRKHRGYTKDSVSIYQSEKINPEKVALIRKALKKTQEAHCESKALDSTINFELYGNVRDMLLQISPDKSIPYAWLWKLSKRQLELFIQISILADGTSRWGQFAIGQKRSDTVEVFQVACLLAGIPGNVTRDSACGSTFFHSSPVRYVYPDKLKVKREYYSGKLWCITVDSGAFYTRCKDKIYVTGNSVDSSSWVQVASFGGIWMPHEGLIDISSRSPNRHVAGQHIRTVSDIEREFLLDKLRRQGFDPDRLAEDPYARFCYNLWAYDQINYMINQEKLNNGHPNLPQELF